MKRAGLVVVGTDTGVGKTCVAAALVRVWRRRGVAAFPWKPYASGVPLDRVEPGEDADLLLRAAGLPATRLGDVSPARFREPLAPAVAAARVPPGEAVLSPEDVAARCPPAGPDAEVLVVEGCGGILVPLGTDGHGRPYDVRELAFDLDLPVLVVARPGLGTLNHTALTVEAARAGGLDVLGVVVSGHDPDGGVAERTNPEALARFAGAPLLGVLPRVPGNADGDAFVEALADALAAHVDTESLLARVRERAAPARAEALAAADRRHVWHPFTQMKGWIEDPDPIVVERGKGAWITDTRGRRYLDAVSSLWTTVHGHRERALDDAVRAQLGRVAHSTLLGLGNEPAVRCAEALLAVAPRNLTRVFYSDSGSTAVEVALKMAFQRARQSGASRRTLFVRFEGAYHGDTIGAVSVGGIDLFHQVFGPLLFGSLRLPAPYAYRRPPGVSPDDVAEDSARRFEDLLRERGEEIAAVVVEPVMQGAAGMIPQPPGWLPRIAAATRAAGALLVCDEVATGFGRTGRMFAVEHEGVAPDLLCVAKGFTGGYLPLAATLTTEAVHDAFLGEPHENRTFFHGHTYTGNPLACAAAIANLRLMAERDLPRRAAEAGESLGRRIAGRIAPHPAVGDVRRRGLMVGIELVRDRATKEPFPAEARVGWRVCRAAAARGLRVRPLGDVLVLMPTLGIAESELDFLVERLALALSDAVPAASCGSA